MPEIPLQVHMLKKQLEGKSFRKLIDCCSRIQALGIAFVGGKAPGGVALCVTQSSESSRALLSCSPRAGEVAQKG